eukprot:18283-Heterococcus_DN1.PRE.5
MSTMLFARCSSSYMSLESCTFTKTSAVELPWRCESKGLHASSSEKRNLEAQHNEDLTVDQLATLCSFELLAGLFYRQSGALHY